MATPRDSSAPRHPNALTRSPSTKILMRLGLGRQVSGLGIVVPRPPFPRALLPTLRKADLRRAVPTHVQTAPAFLEAGAGPQWISGRTGATLGCVKKTQLTSPAGTQTSRWRHTPRFRGQPQRAGTTYGVGALGVRRPSSVRRNTAEPPSAELPNPDRMARPPRVLSGGPLPRPVPRSRSSVPPARVPTATTHLGASARIRAGT